MNRTFGLLFIILLIPGVIFSQSQSGRVLSSENDKGIGFVNIGIIGKNTGTVSDESGNFSIDLSNSTDRDSVRFSMIGYSPRTFSAGSLKSDTLVMIYMYPKLYDIVEVKVVYRKPKAVKLGVPVTSPQLKSGFSDNELGSEMGIFVRVKGPVKLADLNLNVATCTYDSVTYRLNVYQSTSGKNFKNILTRPIYFSFSKDNISKPVTFDLRPYSIIVRGNVLITLELYKDMGEGRLLFNTQFFTGITYHRKTSEGDWIESPGAIGMYLNGFLMR